MMIRAVQDRGCVCNTAFQKREPKILPTNEAFELRFFRISFFYTIWFNLHTFNVL